MVEAAVLGAAMIAAVGAGAFASLEESSEAFHKRERVFTSCAESHAVYEELGKSYVRLYQHVYSR
jgi:sugar (pentulose or hexulose) kinase